MPTPLLELAAATFEVTAPVALRVLGPVDLSIRAKEHVAVVGPSGAGKSTLVSLLGGMQRLSAGTYRFAGRDLTSSSPRALARFRASHVGFLFQSPQLLEHRSVVENVELGYVGAGHHLEVREALELVGVGPLARRPARVLSGGERQRVALARALVKAPDVLIADEPTGSLDTVTGARILDLLAGLRTAGTTLVVVTHDLRAAQRADRVLHIEDGRLRDAG